MVGDLGQLLAAAIVGRAAPVGVGTASGYSSYQLGECRQSWADLGLARRSWWRTLLVAIGGWFAVSLLIALAAAVVGRPDVSDFDFIRGDRGGYVFMLGVGWTTAAFGEEMIFRGFLLDRLAAILGRAGWAWGVALVVQAALFGAVHFNQGPRGIALTGWLFGAAFLVTRRNLWASILIHGFIDTVGTTALYLGLDKMS